MIVLDPTTRQPIEITDPQKRLEYSRRLQQRKATSPAPSAPAPAAPTSPATKRQLEFYRAAVARGAVKANAPSSGFHLPKPVEQQAAGDRFAVASAGGVVKNFPPEDFKPGGKYWPK